MKVTITKADARKAGEYNDACNCLLATALRRTKRLKFRQVTVFRGCVVLASGDKPWREILKYPTRKYESQLRLAHEDSKLLPMTIELELCSMRVESI